MTHCIKLTASESSAIFFKSNILQKSHVLACRAITCGFWTDAHNRAVYACVLVLQHSKHKLFHMHKWHRCCPGYDALVEAAFASVCAREVYMVPVVMSASLATHICNLSGAASSMFHEEGHHLRMLFVTSIVYRRLLLLCAALQHHYQLLISAIVQPYRCMHMMQQRHLPCWVQPVLAPSHHGMLCVQCAILPLIDLHVMEYRQVKIEAHAQC